jgi:cytochrome c551/c552
MPVLFAAGRQGFVERWLVTEKLLGPLAAAAPSDPDIPGDHRAGRTAFLSLGCVACHPLPERASAEQPDLDRIPFLGLTDRFPAAHLSGFLGKPRDRYPDGRMPPLPLSQKAARDIAAYLLLWSKRMAITPLESPPTLDEIRAVYHRFGVGDRSAVAAKLIQAKGCAQCHPGLEPSTPLDVPLAAGATGRGCLGDKTLPRYSLASQSRQELAAYLAVAADEKYSSPVEARQRLLARAGCVHCHQRDTDSPPPIEVVGSTLAGSGLETVPYQRTPRLTYANQKYTAAFLLAAVRDGVQGLRGPHYTYRMPPYGSDAGVLLQALAEGDGDVPPPNEPAASAAADPTLGPLVGSPLAGFQGYACISCHVWHGHRLADTDPGAVGPDLTRVAGRIRRDWFGRFLEDPARFHPGTPMPAVFPPGRPAALTSFLDGDARRQTEALWSYFALGSQAPSPAPPQPLSVDGPAPDEAPLVAQIPLHLPDRRVVESICVLYGTHDLVIYDLAGPGLDNIYVGAEILRQVQGRLRSYLVAGIPVGLGPMATPCLRLLGPGKAEALTIPTFHGYDRLADGVRLRWAAPFSSTTLDIIETLQHLGKPGNRELVRELRVGGLPPNHTLEWRNRVPQSPAAAVSVETSSGTISRTGDLLTVALRGNGAGQVASASLRYALPPARTPPARRWMAWADPGRSEGSLERPGYQALAYPRPKTRSGEDRVMPAALAVHPRTGRVFIASLKTGELFTLDAPADDGKKAQFRNYAQGLFEDSLALHAEDDALYVLHRRNLTRVVDSSGTGRADRFDRVAALPHGIADTYDYAYGLVRDKSGGFILSYAPYANTQLPGSGGAVRLEPGKKPQEIAFGFRNPLGWCAGPEGELFFTDNQGEWVATNKLCHLVEGRFYGFPNPAQRQHTSRPRGRTAVWIPYGWARSINGVADDNTGGQFGPFAGQFFLAELMYGGALIRAQVEKVNGEYQGACFPFWGKGLLGPLTLAFDPKGRLFVGGITEPGWMAQPDRGALFRIDFVGPTPFEIQSVHARPRGFRLIFTTPLAPETVRSPAAFHLEHYRYEYTGAYGSPEWERTTVPVERVVVSADRRSVELVLGRLIPYRVYLIQASGVQSAEGRPLVHAEAAYTLNEVPRENP